MSVLECIIVCCAGSLTSDVIGKCIVVCWAGSLISCVVDQCDVVCCAGSLRVLWYVNLVLCVVLDL